MNPQLRPLYLKVQDVVAIYGLSARKIWNLLAAKKISGRKIGKLWMIEIASIVEFFKNAPGIIREA